MSSFANESSLIEFFTVHPSKVEVSLHWLAFYYHANMLKGPCSVHPSQFFSVMNIF